MPKPWSVEDFLAWEAEQEERYQYVDGIVLAMVGGTLDHNAIVGNLYAALRSASAAAGCRVFFESVKVVTSKAAFYPDIVVTCADVVGKDDRVRDPVIIVEVLSRSTEEFDRGRKWLQYQGLTSLQDYLLVSQDELRVDHYHRKNDLWEYSVLTGAHDSIALIHPAATIGLTALYAGTSLEG